MIKARNLLKKVGSTVAVTSSTIATVTSCCRVAVATTVTSIATSVASITTVASSITSVSTITTTVWLVGLSPPAATPTSSSTKISASTSSTSTTSLFFCDLHDQGVSKRFLLVHGQCSRCFRGAGEVHEAKPTGCVCIVVLY